MPHQCHRSVDIHVKHKPKTLITHTVPAGKYTAGSQSAADALALQEINTELSKCPQVIGEFELQGKKIIVYEDWTIIVK